MAGVVAAGAVDVAVAGAVDVDGGAVLVELAVAVAVLVTVVVPTAKPLPLAGLLLTVTPGQLSVALTVKFTLLLQAAGAALTAMFFGVSLMTTAWPLGSTSIRSPDRCPATASLGPWMKALLAALESG